jgi:hypothetical protein
MKTRWSIFDEFSISSGSTGRNKMIDSNNLQNVERTHVHSYQQVLQAQQNYHEHTLYSQDTNLALRE